MVKTKLLIALPGEEAVNIKRSLSDGSSVPWLYLGKDYLEKRRLVKALGERFRLIDIVKTQEAVADDIRREHVDWIDAINRKYGKDLYWWFGPVSSRNLYMSNLFQYACYLEILERLWREKKEMPGLVVAGSEGLAKAIDKWARKNGIEVRFVYGFMARLGQMGLNLIPFLRWGKIKAVLFLRWVAAILTRKYRRQNFTKEDHPVIVDTFVHNNSFVKEGLFDDRYYPHLYEYLRKKGLKVLVHPVLYGFGYKYSEVYKNMRRSNTDFIIQEDFLHFSDYICALSYPIMALFRKIEAPLFRGFDLSDVLREDSIRHLDSGIQPVLVYRLFSRLEKAGLKPNFIIDWYENQPIDRALVSGARRAYPKTAIIGVQMFIHLPNHLSLYPSESEVEAKIVPDILIEMSDRQCEVAKTFTRNVVCKAAASLRYSYIFNDPNTLSGQKAGQKTIMVLLPFDLSEALEILETIHSVLGLISDGVQISIKCHPDYSARDLIHMFGEKNWPDRFNIFEGALTDALKESSIVISSNSSSVIEAITRGVPAIFLGRQTVLSQNISKAINNDITSECFSDSELIAAVNKYLNISDYDLERYKDIGNKARGLFFSPINENTMAPFLEVRGN